MKRILAALALLSAMPIAAIAGDPGDKLRLDVMTGQCRQEASTDGTYWQRDQEHSNRYKTNGCIEYGAHWQLTPVYGLNVRFAPNMGTSRTRALAYTCPNDDCTTLAKAEASRPECKDGIASNCKYLWKGEGGIRNALTFSVDAEVARLGPVGLELEGGATLYRMTWHQQVSRTDCEDGDCAWRLNIEQRTGYFITPMIGAGVRWRASKEISFVAGTQYYFRTTEHTPATMGFGGRLQKWMIGASYHF